MIEVKLEDICLNITDGKHGDCKDENNSGFYFISCKDVYDGFIHYDNARQITEKDFVENHKRTMLEPNDILITNSGTIGRMAFVRNIPQTYKTTFQKSVAIIKPNQEIIRPNYLYYSLVNYTNQFINESNGSAQKNLLLGTMREFKIKIEEDFEKQDKIIGILSSYDSLIENNKKQIKCLEEILQRLYKEWFIDFHFPGNENVKIVSGTPEGWEKRKIQDICIKIGAGGTPSRSKMNYWENGKIRWFKTGELLDGYLIESEEHITTDGLDNSSAKLFPKNTILMAIYASPTLGRLGILSEEACSNQAALGFISDEKQISFMWLFYKLLELRNEFNLIARGAGQQNISADVVKNTIIVKPTKDLIDKFSNWCKPVFDDILILRKNIIKLSKLRDILLPKLMSCEIEV